MKNLRKRKISSRIVSAMLCFCILSLSAGNYVYAEDGGQEANGTEGYVQEDMKMDLRSEQIGERLDGDWAYISNAGLLEDTQTSSGYKIRTGTAPWDDPEEEGTSRNDTSEFNNVVRSFDTVSYTIFFHSEVRKNAPYKGYQTGTVHFEFVLPGSADQIQYETGSMGWLKAKREVQYDITEEIYEGETCQVLKGNYLWEPSAENPSAIGNSYQELSIVLRVLAMKRGEIVKPAFTFWLEGNEVPDSGLVTGSGYTCGTHNEQEYKTIETPSIEVTTAPRYNVQLKTCDERAEYIGDFNFSTGNEYAQNKDAGTIYGRANVVGITLQIVGKSPEHGLRGCEVPDGSPITFTVDVSSEYRGTDGKTHDTSVDYSPLLWSLAENQKSNTQYDGREIAGTYKFAANGAPMNVGKTYESCYNGGCWTAEQTGNQISITVSDYAFNLNNSEIAFPYADGNVSQGVYTYYDPTQTDNYWEIQKACFSAGELWIIQPFYDENENYIVDKYDAGSFNITLSDAALKMTGESGQQLDSVSDNTNQMNMTDDRIVVGMALEKPGTIDQLINYQKYEKIEYGTSLTDGCFENGKDWIVAGGKLNIQEMLKQNTAEGMYTGVGYDDLIKFDDTFFDLEAVEMGSNAGLGNMTWKFLYGARADKTGWDHNGKEPSEEGYDTQMMQANADDLIFFTSLDELKKNGYVCCAVLWEARGVASSQSTNCYIGLKGTVKESALAGNVYMVTHCARAWNKKDVQQEAASYTKKNIVELTDTDYAVYMQEAFPDRADQMDGLSYEEDYPSGFWNNEYDTRAGLKTYIKSKYDKNGYAGGSEGLAYGDSCLVVAYTTKIVKDTEQKSNGNNSSKRAYDLDANQRIADYVLNTSAVRTAGESHTENARIITDVYIEDTLPQGLTYITGSAFLGGNYVQRGEGRQGYIEGGSSLEPDITKNAEGQTVLKWTLKDVVITENEETYFLPLHYSCEIGTAGVEATDVKNNEQLLNSAVVWGSGEQKRDFTAGNGNLAAMSIQVSKNNAVSMSKLADAPFVEVGEQMGAVMNIGNNSENTMQVIAMDSLPYEGDMVGSKFSGECQVTEFTIQTPELLNKLTIYYSNEESQRGKTSVNYSAEEFAESTDWMELQVDPMSGKAVIPENFAPIAIAAVGEIPGGKTLKMHISMYLPEGKAGDYAINRLTQGEMESDSRTYLVCRTLEGMTWIDKDQNGMSSGAETKLNGITVTLMKLKAGGNPEDREDYEVYEEDGKAAVVRTGEEMNLSDGEIHAYTDGYYRFEGLPAGIFGVLFTDGTFSLYGYQGTAVDQGEDDTIDSDAVPEYEGQNLKHAFITNIEMPEKEQMKTAMYSSKYHDFGIYQSEEIPDTGIPENHGWITGISLFGMAVLAVTAVWKKKRSQK